MYVHISIYIYIYVYCGFSRYWVSVEEDCALWGVGIHRYLLRPAFLSYFFNTFNTRPRNLHN